MKHTLRNRILSCLLIVAVLATVLLFCVFAVTSENFFQIAYQGESVANVVFSDSQKKELTLNNIPSNAQLQWQIRLTDGETWVNISGQSGEKLVLSYALVASLLDHSGNTAVRCVATEGDKIYVTDPVQVQMTVSTDTLRQPMAQVQQETVHMALELQNVVARPGAVLMSNVDPQASKVTITVNYEYGEKTAQGEYVSTGNAVNADYIAEIIHGDPFKTTVGSYVIAGYQAEHLLVPDGVTGITLDGSGNVVFDMDKVEEDIDVTVLYMPIEVEYRVSYYYQNIDNDDYTYIETKTYKDFTGLVPTKGIVDHNAPGFTMLDFSNVDNSSNRTIAADGSTHINCYLDRNYYLVNFDLDGGYGTDPVYARYGTILVVPNPARAGYTFGGWDLIEIDDEDGNIVTEHAHVNANGTTDEYQMNYGDGIADTMNPAVGICVHGDDLLGNYTYKALWRQDATTFTVVFWVQNANDDGYSYAHSISNIAAVTGDVINLFTVTTHKYTVSGVEYSVPTALPDNNALKNYSQLIDDVYTDANGTSSIAAAYAADYSKTDLNGDYGVVVEGDGSTVFNIYYKRNEYTLKFYYAMIGYFATDTHIYVIGGSTYYFGGTATAEDKNNEIKLLDSYMTDTENMKQRGTVDEIPWLNEAGVARYGERETILKQFDESTIGDVKYEYYYLKFTARYGADISDLWPSDVFNSVTRKVANPDSKNWDGMEAFASAWNGEFNVKYTQEEAKKGDAGNQTIKGKYSQLDENLLWQDMRQNTDNTISFLCFWENGTDIGWSVPELYRYNIYLECLAGVDYSEKTTVTKDGVTYYLADTYDTCDDSNVDAQTQPGLPGYHKGANRTSAAITDFDTSLYKEAYDVNFFYIRKTDNVLSLKNYGEMYQTSSPSYGISLQTVIPSLSESDSPDTLEPNAYEFAGWYTGPNGSGDRVEFDDEAERRENGIWYNPTMPDENLILFAYWTPITRTVDFYDSYDDSISGGTKLGSLQVPHGMVAITSDIPANPTRPNYIFIGWFYINDQGEKTAFHPGEMAVRGDMKLFAEWNSQLAVDYTIYYLDEHGNDLADPLTGSTFAGRTMTFTAKAGDELNLVSSGVYFPTVSSQSLLMSEDEANMIIFKYTKLDSVQYTVQYIDVVTGTKLADNKVVDSTKAIVTEEAKLGNKLNHAGAKSYIPQTFYKTMVLSSDPSKNIITFYYTEDTLNGGVVINYYTQDLTGGGYSFLSSTYFTSPAFRYYDDDNDGTFERSEQVVIEAKDYLLAITGFTWDNGAYNTAHDTDDGVHPISGNVTVGGVLELNVYYTRNTYSYTVYHYAVNSSIQVKPSESGSAPYGATATRTLTDADKTFTKDSVKYNLVGDQSKTVLITEDTSKNIIIFYYEPIKTELTIKTVVKDVNGNILNGCTDTFIFSVRGPTELQGADGDITIYVTVQGNGSVVIGNVPEMGLYVGTYKVIPQTDWSYQYRLDTVSGAVSDGSGKYNVVLDIDENDIITFTFVYTGSDWLGGEDHEENVFPVIGTIDD